MVQRVSSLVTQDAIGMIEAPTGTGKSLGYLIPAIVAAVTEDKVAIISTATASLQDQLALKDVPQALAALSAIGINGIKCAVAKGRERHLCPIKLDNLSQTPDLFQTGEATKTYSEISDAWEDGSWNGQRDTLPIKVLPNVWSKISNTSASCVGEACPSYDGCPYYESVKAAKEARVVIVNHDYLLANMANVPNSFLCDGEKNIYVFDEAHHLGDKILSAFAHSLNMNHPWREELRRIVELFGSSTTAPIDMAATRLQGMWNAVAEATATILGDSTQHRFTLGEAPVTYLRLLLDLQGSFMNLRDVLDDAIKAMSAKSGQRKAGLLILLQSRVGQLKGEINRAITCLDEFTMDDQTRARWLSKSRTTLEIKCSPFNSAEKACKHVWPNIKRAVLTSATLTSLGSFDPVRAGLGLPASTTTLKLDSPLDYSQARLVVPRLAVDGNHAEHGSMVRAFVMDYAIRSGQSGILVYFTSRKLMTEVYNSLSVEDKNLVILQGNLQPSAMVDEHKSRIDAGQRSILFGLDSLSEGVDLPGAYCTRVLVTRLPFPSPDDPVIATHSEHLTSIGLKPFHLLTLPKAALKFAQVIGRLVRREGDSGDVVILDQRLRSKTYGRQMARNTPFREVSFA
ncbi:hypothetical protein LP417_35200 (plasmid) [Polaromonas sp. P1-6]|nr:hypothetical protein LP417_35200 [Polaromonas sp. P1-6]